jgi:hypothetical protein
MNKLIAFHGEQGIKDQYLARVLLHRKADELCQGVGWESNGKTRGCAVGCTLEAYDHSRYPIELGIPVELAYLEDQLFELQTPEDAQLWPERFLNAIPVGADLSKVFGQWAIWMLTDPEHGVIKYAGDQQDVREAIERVADCWRRGASPEEFRAAAEAAWAARAAARAAAEAARAAARAAAWAAEAAEAAAWAAEAAAEAAWAARAAEAAWVTAACDKLIELLRCFNGR